MRRKTGYFSPPRAPPGGDGGVRSAAARGGDLERGEFLRRGVRAEVLGEVGSCGVDIHAKFPAGNAPENAVLSHLEPS